MSKDWAADMQEFHRHYGVLEKTLPMDGETVEKLLEFKFKFLMEEWLEGKDAIDHRLPEEVVDSLIDLIVVAMDTLGSCGIDMHKAWDAVYEKNMQKEVGIKKSRPNPLGLPDLIKPEGWTSPSHEGNHGIMTRIIDNDNNKED